jgi:hypothetical protein
MSMGGGKTFFFGGWINFTNPKLSEQRDINYAMKQQGATQPLTNSSKWLGRKRKLSWNIYSMQSIPAQDFMVRILRSRTTMLRRWVMSPNNLNKFMITALSLSLSQLQLFLSPSFLFFSFILISCISVSFPRFCWVWDCTRVVYRRFFQAAKSIP